jgi:hypothetical protein
MTQTTKTSGGFKVFNSVYSTLFGHHLFRPLKKLVSSFESFQSAPPMIVKHVVVGDDKFLDLFVQSLYGKISHHISQYSFLIFSIVFIPSNETTFMGNYLASICPIYSLLINSVYSICSSIAPTHDENSGSYFLPIEIEKTDFENNIWFCDPSPGSIFQNSINLILYFGNYQVAVPLWNCRIQFEESRYVDIPWITSIHVGNLFDPSLPIEPITLTVLIFLPFLEESENQ